MQTMRPDAAGEEATVLSSTFFLMVQARIFSTRTQQAHADVVSFALGRDTPGG
jgi:hypothetical protein